MRDNRTLLPLQDPNLHRAAKRRHNVILYLDNLLRFLIRRRLKFYIFAAVLITIFCLTLLHKSNTRERVVEHHKLHLGNEKRARFEARTMRTIIGRYVGPKLDLSTQNLSDAILNSNNYDPDPSMGKDGRPVYLPGYPKLQMQALFSINRFNLAVSDKISVDRKLPDARKLTCRKKDYNPIQLPPTSIIIVFHNEAWSTLVRTVHSVLNTADKRLISEILLVDDYSNRTFLGKTLENYMNNLSSVYGVSIKILRSHQRIGLIRSRLIGVEAAHGKVLTFLDAHCEATIGWLEPLLEQVQKNRRSAACPIIDIINEDNFAYTRSFELHMGAINWGLNFRWYPISKRELMDSNVDMPKHSTKEKLARNHKKTGRAHLTELVRPFNTPIMAGGLFSIDRDYFNEIGQYDAQMDIWGGENIELSLRMWQCGGEVKIVPCSHVAHIFRKSSPYTFRPGKEVGDILYTNLARVAEVWMDEWRNFFYALNPIVNRTLIKVGRDVAFEKIEHRKQLRQRLGCNNFQWFLDNVWPEHFFPTHDRARLFGKFEQRSTGLCLQRPIVRNGSGQAPVGPLNCANCTSKLLPAHQLFVYNKQTKFLMTDENVCLDSGSDPMPSRQVILAPCSESQRQKWHYDPESRLIKHEQSNLCLSSPKHDRVQLDTCEPNNEAIQWIFRQENWH